MRTFYQFLEDNASCNAALQAIERNEDLAFFFTKDGDVYGAPEESRMTFARLKKPDEYSDKYWAEQAMFWGINLKKVMEVDSESAADAKKLFTKKDLKNLKVIDRSEAMKLIGTKLKESVSDIDLAAQKVLDLFKKTKDIDGKIGDPQSAGLLAIYIKPNNELWVNVGDWSNVPYKDIEKTAGIPVEIADEAGKPSDPAYRKFH